MVKADLQPGATTLYISYGITAPRHGRGGTQGAAAGMPVSTLAVQTLWPVPEEAIIRAIIGGDEPTTGRSSGSWWRN